MWVFDLVSLVCVRDHVCALRHPLVRQATPIHCSKPIIVPHVIQTFLLELSGLTLAGPNAPPPNKRDLIASRSADGLAATTTGALWQQRCVNNKQNNKQQQTSSYAAAAVVPLDLTGGAASPCDNSLRFAPISGNCASICYYYYYCFLFFDNF